MSLFFKYIIKTNIIFLLSPLIIYAQWPPDAAVFPLDVKTHNMGNSFYINNIATTNLPEQYLLTIFQILNMAENGQKSMLCG